MESNGKIVLSPMEYKIGPLWTRQYVNCWPIRLFWSYCSE